MSEPKKETVRIVLPPRRDGQPLASNPRETAMINLPPKPVQKPVASESPPPPGESAAPAGESAAPETGAILPPSQPPSIPAAAPKVSSPSGFSVPPLAPKRPPSLAGVAPTPPRPPSVSAWRCKACFSCCAASGRSKTAGHGRAVGIDRSVCSQGAVAVRRARAGSTITLGREQEGDRQGSAKHFR